MRVFCPESWPQLPGVDYSAEISLTAILPKVGQQTHALFFAEDLLPAGEVACLLWKPPLTAINGWDERPSEIAESFIVAARAGHASMIDAHQYRYDFEVVSCEPLLPKLRTLSGDWTLKECLDTTRFRPKLIVIWEEVSWCGIADVDGLKYISANTSTEAQMELLVEEVEGEFFGLLSTHYDPGGEDCYLGRRKFSKRESSAVKAALKQAVSLVDKYEDYLLD